MTSPLLCLQEGVSSLKKTGREERRVFGGALFTPAALQFVCRMLVVSVGSVWFHAFILTSLHLGKFQMKHTAKRDF